MTIFIHFALRAAFFFKKGCSFIILTLIIIDLKLLHTILFQFCTCQIWMNIFIFRKNETVCYWKLYKIILITMNLFTQVVNDISRKCYLFWFGMGKYLHPGSFEAGNTLESMWVWYFSGCGRSSLFWWIKDHIFLEEYMVFHFLN